MNTKKKISEHEGKIEHLRSKIEELSDVIRELKNELLIENAIYKTTEKQYVSPDDLNPIKENHNVLANYVALLEFKIDNPQKYQKGLRVGDEVISDVKIERESAWNKTIAFGFNVSISDYKWSYELTNTKTGDKTTCSEYTLTQLIEAREKADAEKKTTKKR